MTMLSCTALGVRIGDRAILSDVSLSLRSGSVTAVIGPNGAGKSTLLSALAGLLTPTSGAAFLDDISLLSMKPRDRARRIAVLPQTPRSPGRSRRALWSSLAARPSSAREAPALTTAPPWIAPWSPPMSRRSSTASSLPCPAASAPAS